MYVEKPDVAEDGFSEEMIYQAKTTDEMEGSSII